MPVERRTTWTVDIWSAITLELLLIICLYSSDELLDYKSQQSVEMQTNAEYPIVRVQIPKRNWTVNQKYPRRKE